MPIQRAQKDGKPGYRWGSTGTVYTYTPGNKSSETKAREKARDQGIAIGDYQAELIERLQRVRKFANPDKVSFDYDGTLTQSDITDLAKRMSESGDTVYILTAHSKDDKDPVLNKADEIGIPHSRVIFVDNTMDKPNRAKGLGISKHWDDNADVVSAMNALGIEGTQV